MDTKPNQYLYNAGSELNKHTQLYETFFRGYDPALGRFGGVDPKAGRYASITPYNYSLNDPVFWNDPMGDESNARSYYDQVMNNTYGEGWKERRRSNGVEGDDDLFGRPGTIGFNYEAWMYGGLWMETENEITVPNPSSVDPYATRTIKTKKRFLVPIRPEWGSMVVNIHQRANFNALFRQENDEKDLVHQYRKVAWLNRATIEADKDEHQTAERAFRHAMRNGNKNANGDIVQSIEEAKRLADEFVRGQFSKALQLKAEGKEEQAYLAFGLGLHTLQDATSPAHYGFQPWSDNESTASQAMHIARELFYPGIDSNLQKVTNFYLDWFENGMTPLPSGNLFDTIKSY